MGQKMLVASLLFQSIVEEVWKILPGTLYPYHFSSIVIRKIL
jgi:hypothetical protein